MEEDRGRRRGQQQAVLVMNFYLWGGAAVAQEVEVIAGSIP